MLLILQERKVLLKSIKKISKHITLASKKQKVDSVAADLRLKKISSYCLDEINTSRITKNPKLASENYNERKKRKLLTKNKVNNFIIYSKVNNFFQDSPANDKSVSKKRKKESQVKFKLSFNRKQGK